MLEYIRESMVVQVWVCARVHTREYNLEYIRESMVVQVWSVCWRTREYGCVYLFGTNKISIMLECAPLRVCVCPLPCVSLSVCVYPIPCVYPTLYVYPIPYDYWPLAKNNTSQSGYIVKGV